jgi:hypothetical protein
MRGIAAWDRRVPAAPPKTKPQPAEGCAGLPAVLHLGGSACPILLQQLVNLFRLPGGSKGPSRGFVLRLRLGSYPDRGIALSYGWVNPKRLDVVMTFATVWRIFSV